MFDGIGRLAAESGWQSALFRHTRELVAQGVSLPEDDRSADWRFLLSASHFRKVLLIGSGLGTLACALSRQCSQICVADDSADKLLFLRERLGEQWSKGAETVLMASADRLPPVQPGFDLISIEPGWFLRDEAPSLAQWLPDIYRLIAPGGTLQLQVPNRAWPQNLFKPARRTGGFLGEYLALLQAKGFSAVRAYAPLPGNGNIPLFYLPLHAAGAQRYFFRELFPLFEMVSPEVKKQHRLLYAAAKAAVTLSLWFNAPGMLSGLMPCFMLFAEREPHG